MAAPWLWQYASEQKPGNVFVDDDDKRLRIEKITIDKGSLDGMEVRCIEDSSLSFIIIPKHSMLRIECK